MAKSKKSKILAMALCASVMTGIYASPVMAEELFVDGTQSVTTNGVGTTKIASLEGLKEITLGDSVKITTVDKGIIRVGDVGRVNTRVHDDGFYVNTSGDDRKTSLTAGTLTLAGNELTSAQLVKIKRVVGKVDVVEGKIGGIRRASTADENRSTYIEETVRVNNNSGLVVYAEDGTTFTAQIDREGNVLTKGVGRFGALEGPNVRMENGVLTVNSIGETDVAKLNAQGLTLTHGETEATLSAEQIARLNTVVTQNGESIVVTADLVTADHFKNNNNSFAVDSNGAVRAAGGKFKVDADGAVRAANGKFKVDADGAVRAADGKFNVGADGAVRAADGKFNVDADGAVRAADGKFKVDADGAVRAANGKFKVDADGAVRAADGKFNVGADGAVRAANGKFNVDADGAVRAANGKFKVDADGAVRAADGKFKVDADGAVRAANGKFKVDADGAVRAADGKFNVGADGAVRAANGKFNVDADGAVRAANGKFKVGADGKVVIRYADGGAIVANENGFAVQKGSAQIVVNNSGIGMQSGTSQVVVNSADGAVFTNGEGNGETVINGGSITTNRITTGTVNGVAIGMNADGDITLGNNVVIDGDFNSDNIAGITRVDLNDSEPGSEVTYIEKNTAVSADGIVVTDSVSGVSTKTKYDGFYVKDKDSNIVSSLKDDGLMLTDPGSGVSTKTKYDGFYVKDKYSNIVSSLKDDGLMLTDQESGETHTLNATDIADIKGIDRVDTNNDGTLDTTVIEKTLAVSETGIAMSKGDMQLAVNEAGFAAVKGENAIYLNENGVNLSAGNDNFVSVTQDGIGLQGGTSQVIMNSNNGAVFRNGDKAVNGETVINGGTITTGSTTITSDSITTKTLNVDKIVLGDKIVDKGTGTVIGGELEIGADGSIKIDNADTQHAVEFNATKTELSANYGGTSLNMNSDGFNLNNGTGENAASLVLNGSGFAFDGPVNLGKGSDVKYTGGNYGTLAKLDATVKDIYDRTDGIYKDAEGNTVISNETGTWDETTQKTVYDGEGSKVVVGDNGTTFENGAGNGTTNIDGSKITSDADGTISGGSGPSTNSIGNPFGTSTSNGEETVYDGENGNTNTVNSSGMTVTNGTSTTVIDAEKVDTKTGNFSDKVTVGIEGNQTVITGGDISVDNSVTVAGGSENKTTINNEGITVGDKGTSIKNDSISVGDGGYIGDGDVRSGEGVSLNDTAERVGHLENRVGKLEDRVDKVGAMAAAIANLRTMGYDPAAPTEVAVGIGQYRDETGAALGLFHYPNRDFMLSLSVSTSGDEVMGGIGATWKFGRKSPEKVLAAEKEKAAKAKLAKAEAMKKAAKEAKIKAQQERHAKLAAQAEAAK